MKKKSNVKKFRKRKTINLGHIIFLIIFIYIIISFYLYLTKEHLTIYEVRRGTISKDTVFNGLILRDEEIYNTDMAGYVYYYNKDGDRVAKNSVVYSIDENQNTTTLVDTTLDSPNLKKDEIKRIKGEILSFQEDFDLSNYSMVYDFKYDLNNAALEIINEQKQDAIKNQEGTGNNTYSKTVNSKVSGVLAYYVDNFENMTAQDINMEHFNSDNYNKTLLRRDKIYEIGSPVYKIVKDNTWDIIIPLDKEQYDYLVNEEDEKLEVTISFTGEGLESKGVLTYFNNGTEYYAMIRLEHHMEKFINQRFVSIELIIDNNLGLKIPNTSIVDKDFYKIPHEFFTVGGDSNNKGLVLEAYDDNDQLILTFVASEIFYEDEEYAYVDTLLFEPNSRIQSETNKSLRLSDKATLKGVYNVNKGYAIFRRIEIVEEGQEYTIVKEGTSYGIAIYDQIALVGDTAIEQQIIY